MIPEILFPYILKGAAVIAIVLAGWGLIARHDEKVRGEVIAKEKAAEALDLAKVQQASLDLHNRLTELERKANEQTKLVGMRLDTNLSGLQHRPSRRATPVSANSSTPPTCTGAGLSREDSEFLTREAAAAATLGVERDDCEKAYEEVRKQLGLFN